MLNVYIFISIVVEHLVHVIKMLGFKFWLNQFQATNLMQFILTYWSLSFLILKRKKIGPYLWRSHCENNYYHHMDLCIWVWTCRLLSPLLATAKVPLLQQVWHFLGYLSISFSSFSQSTKLSFSNISSHQHTANFTVYNSTHPLFFWSISIRLFPQPLHNVIKSKSALMLLIPMVCCAYVI